MSVVATQRSSTPDPLLLGPALALISVGLVAIASASI